MRSLFALALSLLVAPSLVWTSGGFGVQRTATVTSYELTSVSCPSTRLCLGVGYEQLNSTIEFKPIAETWNGRAWRLDKVPFPSGATYTRLTGVSCPSSSLCVAVGYANGKSIGQEGLVEKWSGDKWSVQPSSNTVEDVVLDSVSCGTTTDCVAVGTATNLQTPFAEEKMGKTWKAISPPKVSETVSCIGRSLCFDGGENDMDRWDGRSWSNERVPTGHRNGHFMSISCVSKRDCQAIVGASKGEIPISMAATWDGRRWAMHKPAVLAGSPGAEISLDGVACVRSTDCEAVGDFVARPDFGPIAGLLRSGKWTSQSTADPPAADADNLTSVSCSAAAACMAVGWFEPTSGDGSLAESWNGSSWQVVPTPVP